MAGDVWVLVDYQREEATSVTFEMLDEGQKIAKRLKTRVVALVCGHQVPDLSATLASYAADVVYRIEHPLLSQYTTCAYTSVFAALIRERNPFLFLLAATANGRDVVPPPRYSSRYGLGFGLHHGLAQPSGGNRSYSVIAPGPSLHDSCADVLGAVPRHNPSRGHWRREAGSGTQGSSGIGRGCDLEEAAARTRVLQMGKADPATLDIAEAEIVVGGGRGLGAAQNWHLVQDLADALGASVGGSRMAMDEGWLPRERLIGQTGKSISPRLYVALGISGAREHVLGLGEAKCVVSINTDPNAPICRKADKAIVGDVNQVVPELVRELGN